MFPRPVSILSLVVSIGVGILFGIIVVVLQLTLPIGPDAKRILAHFNWPVNITMDWWAHTFYNGNTDQLIPQFMVLWSVYWLAIGTVLGLIGYGIWQFFGKRSGQ